MVDKTDVKIIRALAEDARISNVQLARQLNIAVSTVSRRIDKLIHENVISIKALPNALKMGFKASAVIGLDVDLRKVDDVCSKLMDNSYITRVVTTFGRFDMLIIADYPDFELLHHFIKQELSQIDGITRTEPFFVSETTKRYEGMFNNSSSTTSVVIDEIDKKLFEALRKNGRVAYSQLANDLGISVATVSRRVFSLVNEDLFRITALPNPAKFGYRAMAGIALYTDSAKVDKIAAQLVENPDVHVVMKIINSYDIFFFVHFTNPEILYQYLKNNISIIDGVLNMETFFISGSLKLSTTTTGLKF